MGFWLVSGSRVNRWSAFVGFRQAVPNKLFPPFKRCVKAVQTGRLDGFSFMPAYRFLNGLVFNKL